MDARITKQRLGNMLSYDWLKMIGAVIAAVLVLSLFFTMLGTRPKSSQEFDLYLYTDAYAGDDFATIGNSLRSKDKGVFSYEILDVGAENFMSDSHGPQVYSTRVAAGEGTVLITSDVRKTDEEGNVSSSMLSLASAGLYGTEQNAHSGFYDARYYLEDCKNYLASFYGENFTAESELDKDAARECFLKRNANDKRYLFSDKKKEGGILEEYARLEKLKADYFAVSAALEEGRISYREKTDAEGNTAVPAIAIGNLKNIAKIATYRVEDEPQTAELVLMFYRRSANSGDLRFESVSFLRYLVDKYDPVGE